MPVLRLRKRQADPGSRRAAISRRRVRLGERRGLVRALQPQEGQPDAGRGAYAAPVESTATRARALRDALGTANPGSLAAVPHRLRLGAGGTNPPLPGFRGIAPDSRVGQVPPLPLPDL